MKLGILTCDAIPNLNVNDRDLIPKLAAINITAVPVIWSNTNINWTDFDALIFRNTWDYFEKQTEFDLWLDKIEKLGIRTLNSISIINKNKHKFYLKDLKNNNIKILPTIFIDKTAALDLQAIIPKHWKKAVLKPAYSGASFQTTLFDIDNIDQVNLDYKSIASEKELLLQEFMPEIKTQGETSFIFFNKKFSHAVNKKPVNGDFRIQEQFGGIYTLIQAKQNIIKQAQIIVDTFTEDLLYARVDGIIIDDQLHLMEIECLEPDLYFDLTENAMDLFVHEIAAALSNPTKNLFAEHNSIFKN